MIAINTSCCVLLIDSFPKNLFTNGRLIKPGMPDMFRESCEFSNPPRMLISPSRSRSSVSVLRCPITGCEMPPIVT